MRGPTHALIGVTTLVAAQQLTGGLGCPSSGGPVLCLAAALLGGLAPDLDADGSLIQSELGVVGRVTSRAVRLLGVRHRGLTHTGLASLLVTAVGWYLGRELGYAEVGLAFGLGYASHLLADGVTYAGIPLLWPLPGRVHLLPRRARLRTGGPAELLICALAGLSLLWLGLDLLHRGGGGA